MLSVTAVAGNIFVSSNLAEEYRHKRRAGRCERLLISRVEIERLRLRRKTDQGTDVGIVLEAGKRLHHGDVLAADKFIVVEQPPEKVATIGIRKSGTKQMVRLAALVGHVIGNRHRPIALDDDVISFPIQSESELDTFRNLFPSDITLRVKEQVFIPAGDVHAHE